MLIVINTSAVLAYYFHAHFVSLDNGLILHVSKN